MAIKGDLCDINGRRGCRWTTFIAFRSHQDTNGTVYSTIKSQSFFCCFIGWLCCHRRAWSLIQAWSINLHLAQRQEVFSVFEDDGDVATVHPCALEGSRHPGLELLDHSTPDRRRACSHIALLVLVRLLLIASLAAAVSARCTWGYRCRCFPESLRFGSRLLRVAPGLCRCWWRWRKRLCEFCADPAATRGWCRCWCESRSHAPTCCRGSHRWRWTQPRTGKGWTAWLFLGGPGSLLQKRQVRSLTATWCGIILVSDCWFSPVGTG